MENFRRVIFASIAILAFVAFIFEFVSPSPQWERLLESWFKQGRRALDQGRKTLGV
ncbi:MAG: hypothetical protein HY282_15895 [Nitrospirae bacterium]|nr:hypothetical protein [Candidatus Manganitrophaceae bacterium]